jgi:hypothetical protein
MSGWVLPADGPQARAVAANCAENAMPSASARMTDLLYPAAS